MAGPPRPPDVPYIPMPPYVHSPGIGTGAPPPPVPHSRPPTAPPFNQHPVTPGGAPGPKPIWMMTPQELQALAFEQARSFYQPILDELHRQQHMMELRQQGSKLGLQKLIEAVQGSSRELGNETGRGLGDAFAGLAGQAGQEQFLSISQDQDRALQDLIGQIMQVTGQIPNQASSILHDLQGEIAAHDKATAPIIRSVGGALIAVDPTGKKPPQVLYGNPAGQKLTSRVVNGQVVWFDPTGKPVSVYGEPKAEPITWKTVNGRLVGLDAAGNVVRTYGKPNEPTPSLDKSIAIGRWVDDHMKPIPSLANVPVPPRWKPSGAGGGKATDAQKKAGWAAIENSYYHPLGNNRRFTVAEIDKKIQQTNAARLKAWEQADPTKRPPQPPVPITRADIARMTPAQKRLMGIAGVERPAQQVYMDLVHSGIPAYEAWKMVRRYYPEFGQGYFPGKAKAAAETAAVDVAKWLNISPGADRAGVKTHQGILDFAARVAQVWGAPLTIGTGTRHNQYVKGSKNESAHWTGWAVDIPMSGAQLTKLGQDALIAAGMPEAQARKVTHWEGGDYNGYNILFNTNVGGNHYNHLHIGLKPSRQHDYPTRGLAGVQPNSVKDYAFSQATNHYGWGSDDLKALNQLWQHESGWDYKSRNPKSGALGIPQSLGHELPPGYAESPEVQIDWGLRYIKSRYGSPSRAWAFWQATVNKKASLAPPDLRATAQTWIAHGWAGY